MIRPFARPSLRRQGGYTLVELLGVMLVALALLGVHLRGPPPDPFQQVEAAGYQIRAELVRALAEAEGLGGEAAFAVDARPQGQAHGRVLVGAGAPGAELDRFRWQPLPRGVQWSRGNAPRGPGGEPLAGARVPAEVRCAAAGCALGGERVVYLLSHVLEPAAVAALTLTRRGTVLLHRFRPDTGRWTPLG